MKLPIKFKTLWTTIDLVLYSIFFTQLWFLCFNDRTSFIAYCKTQNSIMLYDFFWFSIPFVVLFGICTKYVYNTAIKFPISSNEFIFVWFSIDACLFHHCNQCEGRFDDGTQFGFFDEIVKIHTTLQKIAEGYFLAKFAFCGQASGLQHRFVTYERIALKIGLNFFTLILNGTQINYTLNQNGIALCETQFC